MPNSPVVPYVMPRRDTEVPSATQPRRSFPQLILALILGVLLGVMLVASLGWALLSRNSGQSLLSHVWSAVTGRSLTLDVEPAYGG